MTSKSSSLPRQPPSCETKTSQDVISSKPGKSSGGGSAAFNRGSRRREPAQGSLSGANPNKPGPRSKAGPNKRPPPRGYQNYYNDKSYKSFAVDNVDEAEEFELGSIFNPGSKKQNYNHLLNFQYDKRGSTGNRGNNNQSGARNRGGHHKKQDTPRVKYDHTHYLQANCQFIVKSDVDYSVQLVDPDIIVDWNNIEQVELRTCGDDKEQTSCPICLFPPTAGKMAECGHVYCWSCILHYLALSDDDYRPCPICHKTITKAGLKSVKILSRHNFTTGDKITMNLMKRERNSLFAVPVSNNFLGNIPNVDQNEVDKKYLKLMTATPAQVISGIIDRERSELEQQWQEEKHQPESCFVQEAINLLDKRQSETEIIMKLSPSWIPPSPIELPDIKNLGIYNSSGDDSGVSDVSGSRHASGVSSDSVSSSEDVTDTIDHDGVGVGHLDISAVQSEKTSGKPRLVFYFYQSSDGQPIFLHALNVEMLVKQYGALENCPPVIEAEILEKEGSVMTTELRDRLRYLKHLSVATNFEVAELDMTGLVSADVTKIFRDQIETRKRRRNRKLRDEKRRERKIQHEESRLMGYPGSMIRVESEWSRPMSSSQMDNDTDQYPAMSDTVATPSTEVPSAISFANITRSKPLSQAPAQSSQQSSGSTTTTTWACLGSVKPLQIRRVIKVDSDNEDDNNEDYVPPPPVASLGDTLAAALQAADGQAQGKGKGKKGGRNKGKTLVLSGAAVRKY